jgi:nucleotide-binding universal stress UspA family protein
VAPLKSGFLYSGNKCGIDNMPDKAEKQTILVPVDFSSFSEAALLKACELASCMGLPIVILHVVHDPSELPGYYSRMSQKNTLVRIEDVAQEMLDEFIAKMTTVHPELGSLAEATPMLVVGVPVGRILEVAKLVNAAMIVMGSQGRTGLDHLLLGSKTEQVVRLSPVPVTVVKK